LNAAVVGRKRGVAKSGLGRSPRHNTGKKKIDRELGYLKDTGPPKVATLTQKQKTDLPPVRSLGIATTGNQAL